MGYVVTEFAVKHADGRIENCHNYETARYLASIEEGAKVVFNS